MLNLFETIKQGLHFNKFQLDDLICVEYNCPLDVDYLDIYSQTDYMVYILSGSKTWKTINGDWELHPGQILYVKKGATIVKQFFEEDFCMLGFFIPDNLIRETVNEVKGQLPIPRENANVFTAKKLITNHYLEGYFQSVLTYFRGKEKPKDQLLKLKLRELLINIVCSTENPELVAYFHTVSQNTQVSLPLIMEANFRYNLSLNEFSKLCHRSLSTFKRDFQSHYNTTPGKWLLFKRLEYASNLLLSNYTNVSQVAFDSGFEDVSHFSRVFKNQYGVSPREYRLSGKDPRPLPN